MANDIILARELAPEFEQDATAKLIRLKVDGTTVVKGPDGTVSAVQPAPIVPTFNGQNGVLMFGNTPIDLSQFLADITVTGGSFDAATQVITLVSNDDDVDDLTIDLSALLGVSTDSDNLLSNGADSKPYLNQDGIEQSIRNVVESSASRNVTSVFGTEVVRGFDFSPIN